MQKTAEFLTGWIYESVKAASVKGVVFGLSGGIDSAVVSVLCKRAFPRDCLGVIMPCHSVGEDQRHAEMVAKKFDIPCRAIELGNVFDALSRALGNEIWGAGHRGKIDLEQANIKPRLRMTVLYYFANLNCYLVAGSGNRSELAVGYFTKYGDGGVDIMPIAGLIKRQVVELAKYLEIPREIIQKPPSAGLWEGQTDEVEMGVTYEELDSYLLGHQGSTHAIEKIESMMKQNAHKRIPPLSPSEKDVPGALYN